MAKKRIIDDPFPGKICRDCAHSYDWGELTAYEPRQPFLCKCQFYEYGRWYKFLKDKACSRFEQRKEDVNG